LRSIGAEQRYPTIIIYVMVDPAEAHERMVSNRRQTGRHDVRDEDFWLVVNAFEPPTCEKDVIVYDSINSAAVWITDELSHFATGRNSQ
jgi:hypothetical protein